jgi:hypothetical protein
MKIQPLTLLLALTAAFTGCSVKVDLADENTTTAEAPPSTITEKSRTAVSLGFLVDQKSEPTPAPSVASEESKTIEQAREPAAQPATTEPPSRGAEDLVPVKPVQNSIVVVTNVVNYDIDIHRHHDTHYHLHEARLRKKPVKVRIEVDQKPARDERCARLLREHLERVAEWEAMFK